MPSRKWALVLTGHSHDLEDWLESFPEHHWPQAVMFHDEILFFSDEMDNARDAHQSYEIGQVLLLRTNGLMRLLRNSEPLELRGVAEIDSDGRIKRHFFARIEAGRLRARGHAIGVALGRDGEIIPPVLTETIEQEKIRLVAKEKLLADALTHISHSNNWFELYKAFECVRSFAGGHRSLVEKGWTSSTECSRFTNTADAIYRHRVDGKTPPAKPMNLEEAKTYVCGLLRRAMRLQT